MTSLRCMLVSQAREREALVSSKTYRITIRGRLTEHLASAFAGMALDHEADDTALVGDMIDQAQLFGVLDRLRDFGIELVAVEEVAR